MINYIIYKIGEFLALNLPLRIAYKVAVFLSDLHSLFAKQDRVNVTANLKAIFPNKDISEIKSIRRRMFRNFAKYLVDFFRSPLLNIENLHKTIKIKNLHYIEQELTKGKGIILLSAHLGNWELGAIAIALSGFKIGIVVLPHSHKMVDNFFNSRREEKGIKIIVLGKAVRGCLDLLRDNKLIALVGDRTFNDTGFLTDFFGLPTYLPKGPVVFSQQTKAPIIPAFVYRNSVGMLNLVFEKPIKHESCSNKRSDSEELLSKSKVIMEDYIKRYPDQWFMFRRFWAQGK